MDINKGPRWDSLPIPLSWLGELDMGASPDALADALGDRYLCRNNPIFSRIRRSAIEFGYRFSAEDTPMWRDYHAFGLTTLHQILSSRVIPYHDTGKTFWRLLEKNPGAKLSPRFILGNFKRNHAFHESAHCVARSVLCRMEPAVRAIAPDERERFVLEAIFGESFANTVETLGSLVRSMPLSDMLFYSLNSYMDPKQDRTVQLEEAAAKSGEYLRFCLLFLASFEANLTEAGPQEITRERIALAAKCGADSAETVQLVTDAAFRLSTGFRESTTPMYFELLGYAREYAAFTVARWLGDADNRQFVRELIAELYKASICSSH